MGVALYNDIERFEKYVEKTDSCWNWTGRVSVNGYGSSSVSWRRLGKLAHRTAYKIYVGTIPDGLQIDHLCRNRKCVNPDHLEPVTYIENQRRAPGTFINVHSNKTHCVNGHEYTEDNTYYRQRLGKNIERDCKACRRNACRRLQQKKRSISWG